MRPDRTALCSLALVLVFLPVAGACLLPLALLGRRAVGAPLWLGYGLWFISALGYGVRPAQLAMARLLWPIRRPTEAERVRLERIWRHVIAQTGVCGRRFRIRAVDLPEANAHSVGRDLVCVTTGALGQLGDRELAGVLAHELGHHLRIHTSASAFLVWVLLPLQGVALLGSLLATPIAAFANALTARRGPTGERGGHRARPGTAQRAALVRRERIHRLWIAWRRSVRRTGSLRSCAARRGPHPAAHAPAT